MTAALIVERLSVDLDGPLLREVSLTVPAGEMVGLIGESGAGKSLLGRAVLGLLPSAARVIAGHIKFEGVTLAQRDGRALGKAMTLIPQNPMSAFSPAHRLEAQTTDVLEMHLGLNRKAARERVRNLLRAVQLEPSVLHCYPHQLSGGMRQRLLVAIAFACQPRLVIADEPTTALDTVTQRQVLRLIKHMQREYGSAVLLITHDLGVLAQTCAQCHVMHEGRIVESATVSELLARPSHPYSQALVADTRECYPDGLA